MKTPKQIIRAVYGKLYYYLCPDKIYLNDRFRKVFGRDIDWKNPTTFNEKLQWLKIYNRNPLYTQLVDKYEVRKYIAEKIGEEYLIPCLGVWDRVEDIDFDKLPNQFVLKCTHDSGSVYVCRDKAEINKQELTKKFNKKLRRNYYYTGREWPYKNVVPRIIAEKYMQDADKVNLPVYKVLCFMGEPKIIQAIQDDKTDIESIDYFDTDWNKLKLKQCFRNSQIQLIKPEQLDKMLELAKKLSSIAPYIRVDFYVINGDVYFSEFTFFTDCGFAKFEPEIWDTIFSEWFTLPNRM